MGNATDINTAMIAMTIISSMRVKPKRRRLEPAGRVMTGSPFGIVSSIARLVHALGVHVENVLSAPRLGVRVVPVASQPPLVGVGHGVLRYAAQVFHFLVHRPGCFDSVHQLFQTFRIVVRIQLGRADFLGIHVVLKLIDRGPDLTQRILQIALLIPLHFITREGNSHGCQDHHDGEGHDQLHQRQTALFLTPHRYFIAPVYCTVTETAGGCTVMACLPEFLSAASVTLTVVVPLPTAVNVSCNSGPVPFTPLAPATRFTSMLASPVSLRISRLGAWILPSCVKSAPGKIISSRSIFGSQRTFTGVLAKSVIFCASSVMITWLLNLASTLAGLNARAATPPGVAGGTGGLGGPG